MLKKILVLASLSVATLMATAPAMAHDGRRFDAPRHVVYVHRPAPVRYVAPAPFYVQRTVVASRPTVIYAQPTGAQVFGGLVLGTILGVAIATH
ncbi:MAG: hypothetical protein ACREVQ_04380 [Burkholderiales bacterium]